MAKQGSIFRPLFVVLVVLTGLLCKVHAREIVYTPSSPIYLHESIDLATQIDDAIKTSASISWPIEPGKIPFLTGSQIAEEWTSGKATVLIVAEPFFCFMALTERAVVIDGKVPDLSGLEALNYLKKKLSPPKDGCRFRVIGFEKYLFIYPDELWFSDPQRGILTEAVPAQADSRGVIYSQDQQIRSRLILSDLSKLYGKAPKVASAGIYERDGRPICEGHRTVSEYQKIDSGARYRVSGELALNCGTHRNVTGTFTQEWVVRTGQWERKIKFKGSVQADGSSYGGYVIGHSLMLPSVMESEKGKGLVDFLEKEVRKSLVPDFGNGLEFRDVKYGEYRETGKRTFSLSWRIRNFSDKSLQVPSTVLDFISKSKKVIASRLVDTGGLMLQPGAVKEYSAKVPVTVENLFSVKLRFVSDEEIRNLR